MTTRTAFDYIIMDIGNEDQRPATRKEPAVTIKGKIEAILATAAAELQSIVPEGAGEAMSLLDELGEKYDDLLDLPEEDQNGALVHRAQYHFRWLVNPAMSALDEFRP